MSRRAKDPVATRAQPGGTLSVWVSRVAASMARARSCAAEVTGWGYSAASPRSPVRTRITSSTGVIQILPSPIFPV